MNNILMNAEMTKAILDGRKVQTRRVTKERIFRINESNDITFWCEKESRYIFLNASDFIRKFSKYKKDEVIWVREPAKIDMRFTEEIHFHYLADSTSSKLSIPKRFIKDGFVTDWMAHCNGVLIGCIKEMARIFLKITDVRVKRLQDIEYEDILAEGFLNGSYEMKPSSKLYSNDTHGEIDFEEDSAMEWWINTWNKTAPKGYKWDDNPYVFVYEFERVKDKKDA